LRNDKGDPRRVAALVEELLVVPGVAGRTGTAIGPVRWRGYRGEYTRGGVRQVDAAVVWRGGRAARRVNALITAICVLPLG
jgi:hypothetical protein